jgi:antitoxin component YwqK of YwqJK toxin-antitoxin module
MNLKSIIYILLLMPGLNLISQTNDSINISDKNGLKQGHWIKKYPNGHTQYNGYFKDNQPVGTFKRYLDNDTLQSVFIFSSDSKNAEATIYHPNGFLASKGRYVNQLKEGKWQFFSARINGYLINEEEYNKNIRSGISLKYYPDSTLLEKVLYINNIRNGEWLQYFPSGKICLRANYINGKLQGSFETFFDNGKPQYTGQYKNDARNGMWKFFNADGTLKYNTEYVAGVAKDSVMIKKDSDYLDALEKNKGKIADPEKTGTIW